MAILEAKAEKPRSSWRRPMSSAQKGVAATNKIIGDPLHNIKDDLRYLFLKRLEHTSSKVIYVTTETNLPILGATTRKVGATQRHSLQFNISSSSPYRRRSPQGAGAPPVPRWKRRPPRQLCPRPGRAAGPSMAP